jgi:selenocysteine-specific translation elongation factor
MGFGSMNKIISIPIDKELGSLIGKKGNETSMSFYNRKVGNDIIVAIAPSDIPGKFYALPNTMILAEQIVIDTTTIDALFGEIIIAASLLDKKIIFTKDSDISKITASLQLPEHSFVDKPNVVTEIESYQSKKNEGNVKVEVDRCFNVKGVGTVLLGVVTRGVLKKHDKLFRPGHEVVVRSIQCQDEEVESADLGSRVGIAAKGVSEEDIRKGDVLSTTLIPGRTSLQAKMKVSKVANEPLKAGTQYSIFTGFNSGSGMIEAVEADIVTIKLDKELQLEKGDTIMLGRLKSPRLFAAGTVTN